MYKNESLGIRFEKGLRSIIGILLLALLLNMAKQNSFILAAQPQENKEIHIITYSPGKLVWDSETQVGEDGVAKLSLFHPLYQNVQAENQDLVIAPGTKGENRIRLKNQNNGSITYTAVLYQIKRQDDLPIQLHLSADSARGTDEYPLPSGVRKDDVATAVTGTLRADGSEDFTISWLWDYDDGALQDTIDTAFGNQKQDVLADVTVGIYLVVTDQGEQVFPDKVKTGEQVDIWFYSVLLLIGWLVFVFMMIKKRKGGISHERK